MSSLQRSLILLIPSLLLSPMALAKEKYQRVVPPEHVVEGLHKVAIIENGNGWNAYFRKAVSETLRSQLGHMMNIGEADTGLKAGSVDFVMVKGPNTPTGDDIRSIAAQTGAQAVLLVTAEGEQTAYETYTEDRSKTVTVNGEQKQQNYTVSCARRDAQAKWTGALYLGSDGTEVLRTAGNNTLQDKDCDEEGDDPLKILSSDDMVGQVLNSGAANLTMTFIPHWTTIKVAFAKDKATSDAVDIADKGDWATAVEMALTLLADDAYNAPAVYLVGFALEMNGRADDAAILYKFAARMKDDALYQQGVTRARQRVTELEVLERAYGLKPNRMDFENVGSLLERAKVAALVPVTGVPAEIKGNRNKRIPVFKENDPSSDVLAMLPGDTEVRRISQKGGMVQIQLPDGQQGWVSEDLIK